MLLASKLGPVGGIFDSNDQFVFAFADRPGNVE